MAVAVLAIGWVATYAAFGLWLAAAIPGTWIVVTIVDLAILARTRRYGPFQRIQLAGLLVLPFLLQWALGGFVASSAVGIWAYVAALGAIFFVERAIAGRWFFAFVAGIAISVVFEGLITPASAPLPDAVRTLFFGLNVIGVGAVAWAVIGYFVLERERALDALDREHARSEELLLNVLPRPIAERLKAGAGVIADAHPEVTVLFADLVGFSPIASRTPPAELVGLLDRVFSAFDDLADRHRLEKIKTIGDAYMVVGGVPEPRPDHAEAVAAMALEMIAAAESMDDDRVRLRIGVDTGPVVAGVIGRRKFSYDLWGDVVNMASRMESHGIPGRIQVTPAVEARLRDGFSFESRGPIEVKGKGRISPFFLMARLDEGGGSGS
ncbi:MAG TPA: adenylate/guanylate cyclase domain-containing protein [Candidatus Limnocylindria bacterium]|nr:adenylate/guanylate cyclase domain-containing protein [Candidatus Limnocylindria bacterium]